MSGHKKIAEICKVSVPFVGKYRGLTINVNSENPQDLSQPLLAQEIPEFRTYETKHGTIAQMNAKHSL